MYLAYRYLISMLESLFFKKNNNSLIIKTLGSKYKWKLYVFEPINQSSLNC